VAGTCRRERSRPGPPLEAGNTVDPRSGPAGEGAHHATSRGGRGGGRILVGDFEERAVHQAQVDPEGCAELEESRLAQGDGAELGPDDGVEGDACQASERLLGEPAVGAKLSETTADLGHVSDLHPMTVVRQPSCVCCTTYALVT